MKKFCALLCLVLMVSMMLSSFAVPAMAETTNGTHVHTWVKHCRGLYEAKTKDYSHLVNDVLCYYYYEYYASYRTCSGCNTSEPTASHKHFVIHKNCPKRLDGKINVCKY